MRIILLGFLGPFAGCVGRSQPQPHNLIHDACEYEWRFLKLGKKVLTGQGFVVGGRFVWREISLEK